MKFMRIKFSKFVKKTLYFNVIFLMFVYFFIGFFNISNIIKFLPDLFLPIYCFFLITHINKLRNKKCIWSLFVFILIYLVFCLLSSFINGSSIYNFIWAFRNNFRYLVYALCFIITFEKEDIYFLKKIFNKIFLINILVVFVEYFIFDLYGDSIGGIFGFKIAGSNSGLLFLLVVGISLYFNEWFNKRLSTLSIFIISFCCLLCAIFAELKAFYLFFVFIVFLLMLLNRFSIKTIMIIFLSILFIFTGYKILVVVDPSSAETMKIENLLEYAGGLSHGYSSENDISRLRAFSQINDNFFKDDLKYKLFGLGFGKCEVSSLSIFNTTFANLYNGYFHYTWFSHSMLFIETGYFGYLSFIFIFIYSMYVLFLNKKNDINNYFPAFIVLYFIFIIMTFYNSFFRSDFSAFAFILFVLPFCIINENYDFSIKN